MSRELDWDTIKGNLEQMGAPIIEGYSFAPLAQLAQAYGLRSHDVFIDVKNFEELTTDVALIVTYADETINNGIYAYCAQQDGSTAMMVIEPSTIAKGPMISRATGDIVDAITGITDLPILTTFDKVEVVGAVLVRTIIEPLMDTLSIPEQGRDLFIKLYLPRFLSNTAYQYLGSETIKEEMVEMEPYTVKALVLEALKPKKDEVDKEDSNVSEDA